MNQAIADAAKAADEALSKMGEIIAALNDADLHRAHRAGGWTVSQVLSHINVATLLWVADVQRLANDPDLDFFFREEVGHDALGYPAPTTEIAGRQIAATKKTLATCIPAIGPELMSRTVTIPDLGTMTIEEWTPLIIGHAGGHVDQAIEILTDREALPAGF